eukprot:3827336-Pyramimonas_sp.AAC.1
MTQSKGVPSGSLTRLYQLNVLARICPDGPPAHHLWSPPLSNGGLNGIRSSATRSTSWMGTPCARRWRRTPLPGPPALFERFVAVG